MSFLLRERFYLRTPIKRFLACLNGLSKSFSGQQISDIKVFSKQFCSNKRAKLSEKTICLSAEKVLMPLKLAVCNKQFPTFGDPAATKDFQIEPRNGGVLMLPTEQNVWLMCMGMQLSFASLHYCFKIIWNMTCNAGGGVVSFFVLSAKLRTVLINAN